MNDDNDDICIFVAVYSYRFNLFVLIINQKCIYEKDVGINNWHQCKGLKCESKNISDLWCKHVIELIWEKKKNIFIKFIAMVWLVGFLYFHWRYSYFRFRFHSHSYLTYYCRQREPLHLTTFGYSVDMAVASTGLLFFLSLHLLRLIKLNTWADFGMRWIQSKHTA